MFLYIHIYIYIIYILNISPVLVFNINMRLS